MNDKYLRFPPQEFECVAALLQLKLSFAPMEDIQQLLQEVKSLAQVLNTSGLLLYTVM